MITRSRIFSPIGIGVLGLSATMALSGCSRGANLNVINRSTAELTNVVATGSGFTQSLGSIPAGKQHSIFVSPRSESDLKLDFDVNGKHFTSKPQGYFEGGKVTATVATDFSVTVDTK
jgi:hypothetical protein